MVIILHIFLRIRPPCPIFPFAVATNWFRNSNAATQESIMVISIRKSWTDNDEDHDDDMAIIEVALSTVR